MHADRRVGRTGATGDEAHARTPGDFSMRFGHEGSTALLAVDHELDLVRMPMETIKCGQETFAWYTEDMADTLGHKAFDKKMACNSLSHGLILADVVQAAGKLPGHATNATIWALRAARVLRLRRCVTRSCSPLAQGPKLAISRPAPTLSNCNEMTRTIAPTLRQIPAGIWVLGFVSLLMDVSSEMIHSLLPLFMVTTLGTSVLVVGLIEGLAESTALIVKVFSGALSDYLGRRKGLAVLGYALGALSKPLFALAPGAGLLVTARLIDRVGKGIRGAPRDALVADVAPPHLRGAAFGLRQSLDTVGAFLGPLLGVGLMLLWANDFRAVFWVAVIPGCLAVALLWFGLKEPARTAQQRLRVNPIQREMLRRLPTAYWAVVGVGALFTMARFSEAFLVLRAEQSGVALALVPLVMVAMNIVYAASAYPFGKLSDRMSHQALLAIGMLVLLLADLVLASDAGLVALLSGVVLWGVHMGMTQGLLATMVADTAPAELRGTAFGFFNLVSGVAMLLASLLAGLLWDAWGASATFYAGAGFCVLSLLTLIFYRRRIAPNII